MKYLFPLVTMMEHGMECLLLDIHIYSGLC